MLHDVKKLIINLPASEDIVEARKWNAWEIKE